MKKKLLEELVEDSKNKNGTNIQYIDFVKGALKAIELYKLGIKSEDL